MSVLERRRLDDGRRFAVVEEDSAFCALGLRFWDAVDDDQVRDGLSVRAWPLPSRRPVAQASRTTGGIYAFHRLPGLLHVERPSATGGPGFPTARPFIVEVRDPGRRFLPVAFVVDLPLPERGLYRTSAPGSPPTPAARFYLFSSVARARRPGAAAVRGDLVEPDTGRVGAWALVRVTVSGQGERWGLADAGGRFVVQFPLPQLTPGFGPLSASPPEPPSPPAPAVSERGWDIAVSVFWEPARLARVPGSDLPDLALVFQQSLAEILPDTASPPAPQPEWRATLSWDGELAAATEGHHELWIVSQGTSP